MFNAYNQQTLNFPIICGVVCIKMCCIAFSTCRKNTVTHLQQVVINHLTLIDTMFVSARASMFSLLLCYFYNIITSLNLPIFKQLSDALSYSKFKQVPMNSHYISNCIFSSSIFFSINLPITAALGITPHHFKHIILMRWLLPQFSMGKRKSDAQTPFQG